MTRRKHLLSPLLLRIGCLLALVGALGACESTPDVEQNGETAEAETVDDEADYKTIMDALQAHDEELATFLTVLDSVNLDDTLRNHGPYTVFAPTNAAFEALPQKTRERLMNDQNKKQLADLLAYHVVEGRATTTSLEGGLTLTGLQGSPLNVSKRNDQLMVNHAQVVRANLTAQNGVVHLIDVVLQPGSKNPNR